MTRRAWSALVLGMTLLAPAATFAYFPPVPPDPFSPPGGGGLGEPEAPEPPPVGPSVPEPASIVGGLTALAFAGAYAWRKRKAAAVEAAA